MGTTTTKLALYKPANGETGWGANLNANADTLDAAIIDRRNMDDVAAKTTPVAADSVIIDDSEASDVAKRVTFTSLGTYFASALASAFASLANGVQAIHALTAKTTPVDADEFVIADSAAANAPKRLTLANLKTAVGSGTTQARWTAFTDFTTTAASACGLILTDDLPSMISANINNRLPVRWLCDGDTNHRYGVVLYAGGDTAKTPHSGTAQAGSYTASPWEATITLASGASAVNGYYNGMVIEILSGTGAGQRAIISDYDGSTKVATLGTVNSWSAPTFDALGLKWYAAADSDSVYAMYHAIIAGPALNADTITELQIGNPELIAVITAQVNGVYSDQTVNTMLYRTLAKSSIPWAGGYAHIVQVGAASYTPDTGTQPRINVAAWAMPATVLGDNANDGIEPISLSTSLGYLGWSEPGTIRYPTNETVSPYTFLDIPLTVKGGNEDAEDLTVCIVLVVE